MNQVDAGDTDGPRTYDLTFTCDPGGAQCPTGQECPTVPRGMGGCDDLPGIFNNPSIKVNVARPVGCKLGLPYGNPFYLDMQVMCYCTSDIGFPQWGCPI